MKLPLTKKQFEALYDLFEYIMKQPATDITGSLLKELMLPIHIKMMKRNVAKSTDNRSWHLDLSPIQAKTYYAFFINMDISQNWQWESIIINQHLNQIEKTYA